MSVAVQTNLDAFNRTFARYAQMTSRTLDEAKSKQGANLGQALYRGFRSHRWGGAGRAKGIAKQELAARTAGGEGTRVRSSLMREYLAQRAALRAETRNFIGPKTARHQARDVKRKVNLWQKVVGREIATRQRGIGALAVSFLWRREVAAQTKGTIYVRNNAGRNVGYAQNAAGFFRIVGDAAEGQGTVNDRYGVDASAIEATRQDMVAYFQKYHAERYRRMFGEAPR